MPYPWQRKQGWRSPPPTTYPDSLRLSASHDRYTPLTN